MDEQFEDQIDRSNENTKRLNAELNRTLQLGRQVGAVMTRAFSDIALRGKNLGDVLRNVALSLSRLALKAAFKPLEKAIGGVFNSLLSAVGGAGAGAGFAKGGALRQGLPVPFAKGGVIAAPVAFPMGGGRLGLAGEAGAEAILPLARGSDGRLGVRAQGAGGGINVIFNVQTPDVDGFARSQTQIAAMLARVVGEGQRNL